ncbi:hypothetical protein AA0X95_00935 [Bacillus sp. 1P10SD]|uniref:hypothetical protein n=1 Tax=Bacillus sp. 1P10SD TaxID=3132265 RepID=UPI0039A60D36
MGKPIQKLRSDLRKGKTRKHKWGLFFFNFVIDPSGALFSLGLLMTVFGFLMMLG